MRLEVGSRSDVGRVRELNEDALSIYCPKDAQECAHKGELFLVADGMGGHLSGEVASRLAVGSVSRSFAAWSGDDVRAGLVTAVQRANAEIYARSGDQGSPARMGTTLVGALLRGNTLHVVNVGDSRAYRMQSGRLVQISRDHSIVADQVAKGLVDAEQARHLAYRNRITRALGQKPTVEVDYFAHALQPGDVIVLCTDGLTGQVQDAEVAAVVSRYPPQEAAARLVDLANQRGGADNVSVIVVRAEPDVPVELAAAPISRTAQKPGWRKYIWLWPIVLVALAAALLLVVLLALIPLTLSTPGLPTSAPTVRAIQVPFSGVQADDLARDLGYGNAADMVAQGRLQGTTLVVLPRRQAMLVVGRAHEIKTPGSSCEFQVTMGEQMYRVTCLSGGQFGVATRVDDGDLVSVLGLIGPADDLQAVTVDVSQSRLGGLSAEWVNWYKNPGADHRLWVYTVAGRYTVGDVSNYGIRDGDPLLVYAQWKAEQTQISSTLRLGKLSGDHYALIP